VIPIAVAAAADTGVSVRPLLMVVEPGGYRFGDYWKLGLRLLVLFVAVATFLVPEFWAF
jgi:di/tricarboxylate transporter